MRTSISYTSHGRTSQKARTRAAIVEAAVELIGRGETATVEAAATAAGIARGTAYRYFPNQRALLAAAHPLATAASLLPDDAPEDPLERLRAVVAGITDMTARTEPTLRAMLRLSLDEGAPAPDLPLRVGRRVMWVAEALEPLVEAVDADRLQALTVGIAAACGIEVRVWLTDIAGLTRDQAAEMQRWMAEVLLLGGLGDSAPSPPSTDGVLQRARRRLGAGQGPEVTPG